MASSKPVIHGPDHLLGGADPIPVLADIGKEVPVHIALVQYENITGLANDGAGVFMDVLGSPGPSALDDIFGVSSDQDLVVTDEVASGFYIVSFSVEFRCGSAWQGPVQAAIRQLGGADDFTSAGAADGLIAGGPFIADTSNLGDANNRWRVLGTATAYVGLLAGHHAPLALELRNYSDHTLNVQDAVVMATRVSSYTLA